MPRMPVPVPPEDDEVLTDQEAGWERNEMIVAMRARGVSSRQVAATFGLSRKMVDEIVRQFRESEKTLREYDPLEVIDEMLMGYQADLEELALLSHTSNSDNVRIGAINARMIAREKIIALLQSTGVLPHDLGKLKVEVDVRYVAARLVAVLSKHDVAEDIQHELLEALRGTDLNPN